MKRFKFIISIIVLIVLFFLADNIIFTLFEPLVRFSRKLIPTRHTSLICISLLSVFAIGLVSLLVSVFFNRVSGVCALAAIFYIIYSWADLLSNPTFMKEVVVYATLSYFIELCIDIPLIFWLTRVGGKIHGRLGRISKESSKEDYGEQGNS